MGRPADASMGMDDEALSAQFAHKSAEIERELVRANSAVGSLQEQSCRGLSDVLTSADDVEVERASMPTHRQNSI